MTDITKYEPGMFCWVELATSDDAAAKSYTRLLSLANAEDAGDLGTAMFRIAEVQNTADAYRRLVIAHPSHPLADEAVKPAMA